jgi:Rrf2 family protein
MLELALNYGKGPVSMSVISHNQNIPVKYLEQLIIPLKKGRLIHSVRGPKGGHMLARRPSEVSVWEALQLLESKFSLVDCVTDSEVCEHADDCLLRPIWGKAYKAMEAVFKKTTLQDIMKTVGKAKKAS